MTRALRGRVDHELRAARDARLADLRARRPPRATVAPPRAVRIALRGDHAVKVVRRRLDAHEDDLLAALPSTVRRVGVEHRLPDRRARRSVQALGEPARRGARARVELRAQEDVDLRRRHALMASSLVMSPSFARSTAILTAAAPVRLRVARLQHVQLAALDRELDVLHVLVVLLERVGDLDELLVDARASARSSSAIGSGVRMPATTSSPCALSGTRRRTCSRRCVGSRVNATPVPESSPMLPNTID